VAISTPDQNSFAVEVEKLLWDFDGVASPVSKLPADKYTFGLRIVGDIPYIGTSVGKAVVRVGLYPPAAVVSTIDVVTKKLFDTSRTRWPFAEKSRIYPI